MTNMKLTPSFAKSFGYTLGKLTGRYGPVTGVRRLSRLTDRKLVAIDTIGRDLKKRGFRSLRRGLVDEALARRVL